MEIERKFLIAQPPSDYQQHPYHEIEQAYLCTAPVVRIRKEDQSYYLTYKSAGLMIRQEHNLPLDHDSYNHLRKKADGTILTKKRYCIPHYSAALDKQLTIELDLFEGHLLGLILAEVEFESEADARAFIPPEWFTTEVTLDPTYQNSHLSTCTAIL